MSETPAGYYTDADAIRAALGKHGPLSRAALVELLAENSALTERIAALESRLSTVSQALATADRLQAKFAQMRGLLDD